MEPLGYQAWGANHYQGDEGSVTVYAEDIVVRSKNAEELTTRLMERLTL